MTIFIYQDDDLDEDDEETGEKSDSRDGNAIVENTDDAIDDGDEDDGENEDGDDDDAEDGDGDNGDDRGGAETQNEIEDLELAWELLEVILQCANINFYAAGNFSF